MNYIGDDDSDLVIDDSKVFKGGGHAYGPCDTLIDDDGNARFMQLMNKCWSVSYPYLICATSVRVLSGGQNV